jgi:Flp pilus assembly protein TadB
MQALSKEVSMLLGIALLVAGVLIAIYPPLLSLVVAVILIFAGISLILISYHYKKMPKHIDNPFVDFFFRF